MRNRIWSGLLALLIGSGAWAAKIEQPERVAWGHGGGLVYHNNAIA